MDPSIIYGVIGPGFLNQVPTLITLLGAMVYCVRLTVAGLWAAGLGERWP